MTLLTSLEEKTVAVYAMFMPCLNVHGHIRFEIRSKLRSKLRSMCRTTKIALSSHFENCPIAALFLCTHLLFSSACWFNECVLHARAYTFVEATYRLYMRQVYTKTLTNLLLQFSICDDRFANGYFAIHHFSSKE